MTKKRRIWNVFVGLILFLFAQILILVPMEGLILTIYILTIGLCIRGFAMLGFYFQMARSMVGGKIVLYRSIFYLDLGLFIGEVAADLGVYVILCTATINMVAGIFAILKARESMKMGSPQWKASISYGVAMILIVLVMILSMVIQHEPTAAVYAYAVGLIISACQRIIRAFKKTAMVYIQ
ncbi:hypothetical protein SAMN02910456_00469 [Ruminococcaceae bacterium YRB3002]|nr:hypothetical protein SAMN02910456_00469 [Ruminococcaceae bacterium YRB3002]